MNPTAPAIVFCTTCKGRTQHLEQTLPRNLADNSSYENAKFLLLDYNSPDHLWKYLQTNHRRDIESGRLVVYSNREPGPFRMAHAKNQAHRLGILEGADILVNMDADNFTGPGFAEYIARQFEQERIYLWARMIHKGPDKLPRGISGRIAVTSSAFLISGGYDEQFATWSPDDKDFNLRLQRLGYTGVEIENIFLQAVLHTDKMRFREYPEAETDPASYEFEAVQFSDSTVVNFGKCGLGTVYRNFSEEALELRPLPTRIFGIGLHKTATTSLHHALHILGFDSAHWRTAHWAKAIWEEMKASGRSLTLEQSYALSDLPIPLLYRELDQAYPGSKFILTTRSEESWIRSVEAHWSPEHNRFRSQWDTDPFTHRIHKILYGQKNFDRQLFLERYRRHNAEVLQYFRGRRFRDFLVMDMDNFDGWFELCRFLERPRPAVPYPAEFITPL